MSGTRDESLLLDDIIDAAERLIALGRIALAPGCQPDREHGEMLLWNLTVLGEASKRLAPSTQERFADIDWSEIARTRDFVVHHYEGIAWKVVHGICSEHLPTMLPRLHEIHAILLAEAPRP